MLGIRFLKVLSLAAIVLAMVSSAAFAQDTGPSAATTLGGVLSNSFFAFTGIPKVLATFAFIFALILAVKSLFEFKDHVDNPSQLPLSTPVKKFLAAGALFAAPYLSKIFVTTLHGENVAKMTYGEHHGMQGGQGLDAMVYKFVHDIYGPMTKVLAAFSYISAIILLIVGISRLIKTSQDGPQGPTGLGTIATFLVVGVLFSLGGMMSTFNVSLFGAGNVSTFATISSEVISNAGDKARIEAVIEAVMAFVMLVGYIAFIRGWFVLRSFADGGQQASIAQALTFLVGGTLAINLGGLVNVLQGSLGITNKAISFN